MPLGPSLPGHVSCTEPLAVSARLSSSLVMAWDPSRLPRTLTSPSAVRLATPRCVSICLKPSTELERSSLPYWALTSYSWISESQSKHFGMSNGFTWPSHVSASYWLLCSSCTSCFHPSRCPSSTANTLQFPYSRDHGRGYGFSSGRDAR